MQIHPDSTFFLQIFDNHKSSDSEISLKEALPRKIFSIKKNKAGTGPSRRHIKGSKIAKGLQSAEVLVNWVPFDEFFRSLTMLKNKPGPAQVGAISKAQK